MQAHAGALGRTLMSVLFLQHSFGIMSVMSRPESIHILLRNRLVTL